MAASVGFWFPGPLEMAVILILGLVLFGGRLPEVGKSIGRSLIEFRKGLRDLRQEVGLDDVSEIRDELRDLTRLPPIEDAEIEEDPSYPSLQEEEEQEEEEQEEEEQEEEEQEVDSAEADNAEADNTEAGSDDKSGEATKQSEQ